MVELTEKAKEDTHKYGLTRAQVERAVENARGSLRAEMSVKAPWGRIYSLYAAASTAWEAPYHIVVIAEYWGEEEVALGVHVVPDDILEVGERGHPPEMLRRLAYHQRFGLEVSVWGHKGPFTAPTTIARAREGPGGEGGVRLTEVPPTGHEVAFEQMARLEAGEVQILLAFAVDATAVKEHLGLG